jgi:hypothetical protein
MPSSNATPTCQREVQRMQSNPPTPNPCDEYPTRNQAPETRPPERRLSGPLEYWQRPASDTLTSASDRANQDEAQSATCNGVGEIKGPLTPVRGGVEYVLKLKPKLETGKPSTVKHRKFVPAKPPRSPKPGERGVNSESVRNLDALLATAHRLRPACLVSLVPPPTQRIACWETLERTWKSFKAGLAYLKKRNNLPPLLGVVEFDEVDDEAQSGKVANFHVGFASTLTDSQIQSLRLWWLKLIDAKSNQGRTFQYDAKGGGEKLAQYLSKDVTFRGGRGPRPVKWPPAWVPKRLTTRLWFTRGLPNAPSLEGRNLRKEKNVIRRKFNAFRGLEYAMHARDKAAPLDCLAKY